MIPEVAPEVFGDTCVFCRIVRGREPATIVKQGIGWIAFEPLNPHAPGHLLFVPRIHVTDATSSPTLTGEVVAGAAGYARSLGAANILTSIGEAATQTVMHLHVHVVPRSANDGLPSGWPWIELAEEWMCPHVDDQGTVPHDGDHRRYVTDFSQVLKVTHD